MKNFELTYNEAAYGSNKPLPAFEKLQAGNISLEYGQGKIRYIKVGDTEILRMIYFAVRDHNWDTIPLDITQENIHVDDESFTIDLKGTCQLKHINVSWDCIITGNAENQITFNITGKAHSTFDKNRVGFCILHPVAECQGKPCRVTNPAGVKNQYLFPKNISPHQPMKDIHEMEWMPASTLSASLRLEGDVFEMEDQRNWTDDSYKTYCTPLDLPFPVSLAKGEVITQKITLEVKNNSQEIKNKSTKEAVNFSFTGEYVAFPSLGIGASTEYQALDSTSIDTISKIPFHHYRIDVDFSHQDWQVDLIQNINTAQQLHYPLLLALFYVDHVLKETEALLQELGEYTSLVNTIYIFDKQHKTTVKTTINHAIENLRKYFPQAVIGAGTNAYFTELNRERVDTSKIDVLTFSVNPQVHAFDNDSLTETLQAQQYTVESTQQFGDKRAIHISPITLQPRFNPNATGPAPTPNPNELPPQTDVRQMSMYAACWLVGSIRYLAAANCKQITYFETAGTRGVIQGEKPPVLPNLFKSFTGAVFPVYHVFKFLLAHQPEKTALFKSSNRLKSECLVTINATGQKRGIITNFCAENLQVQLNVHEELADEIQYLVVEPDDVQSLMHDANYMAKSHFNILQIKDNTYQFDLPAFGLIFIKSE